MSKHQQAKSATTRIDVITPALGPVPALYVPIRRLARPARSK